MGSCVSRGEGAAGRVGGGGPGPQAEDARTSALGGSEEAGGWGWGATRPSRPVPPHATPPSPRGHGAPGGRGGGAGSAGKAWGGHRISSRLATTPRQVWLLEAGSLLTPQPHTPCRVLGGEGWLRWRAGPPPKTRALLAQGGHFCPLTPCPCLQSPGTPRAAMG